MESVYDYLVVKIWTGLRISEINALETHKHIDLKNNQIKVRQSIVKGKIGPPKTKSSDVKLICVQWFVKLSNGKWKGRLKEVQNSCFLIHKVIPYAVTTLERRCGDL